jgi:hypothetical protein
MFRVAGTLGLGTGNVCQRRYALETVMDFILYSSNSILRHYLLYSYIWLNTYTCFSQITSKRFHNIDLVVNLAPRLAKTMP